MRLMCWMLEGSLSQSERQTFVQRLRRLSEQTAAAYLT